MGELNDIASFSFQTSTNSLHLHLEESKSTKTVHKTKTVAHRNNAQNHGFEKKRNFTVINGFKEYDVENKSEIESDSNEEIQYIGDYLYLDGEEVDRSHPADLDVNTLQKFLQREMEFYSAAFPQDTLSQSFLSVSRIISCLYSASRRYSIY